MTTAATSLLGLALPVAGELSGTWGDTVNNSLTALLDTAVAGTTTLSADVDVTLTSTTLATNQARQAIILWTAGGTVTRTITAPAQSKTYAVINKTSSTQSIKIVGAGPTTGVTVVAGTAALVAWNGLDFVLVAVSVIPLASGVSGTLPVANGGTGATTITSNAVLIGNGTSAVTSVAPSTSGNVLSSNGTSWVSSALPATFPSGGIIMWSGSIASIPSGWLLCNGTSGTPDLRDRFVVGAGSTYAVAATGGSADAVVVTHTHTATSTTPNHNHSYQLAPSSPQGIWYGAGTYSGYTAAAAPSAANTVDAALTITTTNASTGVPGTNQNLPPYYALAYIMKS